MSEPITTCSLDYLLGTLATAYRGLVTSLVVKAFCISEDNGNAVLKGTIISVPEGEYQASLIHEGREVSRSKVRQGSFSLTAEKKLIRQARNLQIDVLQRGLHIGTFLLKREGGDEFFSSAMELSQDIRGINFKDLASVVKLKPGLLRAADDIITKILSTKKDWAKLSEEIRGFTRDLFWYSRDGYYRWFEVLVRYTLKACEKSESPLQERLVENVLSLIELPLKEETDEKKLKMLAETWLWELKGSSIDLSYRLSETRRVLAAINDGFPDADIVPAVTLLLGSLESRLMKTPVLGEDVLEGVKGAVTAEEFARIDRYSAKARREALAKLKTLEVAAEKKGYRRLLDQLELGEALLLEDTEMIEAFFEAFGDRLSGENAVGLAEVLSKLLAMTHSLSPNAFKKAMLNTSLFLGKIIRGGMMEAAEVLLNSISKGGPLYGEDIALNLEIASSILLAGRSDLIERYRRILLGIVIPSPQVRGFSDETWAEIVNPLHLERLSKFLKILSLDTVAFRDVLVHVICNLFATGVFIPDDRIFQREVSSYLNSASLKDDYLLNQMLLKKLPVYYNEVGATGRIRDFTTGIDSWGNDPVLYFLRKQVHANASNLNIPLLEAIIRSWVYQDPSVLKGKVPDDVMERLSAWSLVQYASGMRPYFEALGILGDKGLALGNLLLLSEEDLRRGLEAIDADEEVRSKIFYLCRIYQEIVAKYSPSGVLGGTGDANEELSDSLREMRQMKETVLSPEKASPEESFYFKRHIAFGIPSVMGSYHESKFDAMGEILRNGEKVRVILEKIILDTEKKQADFSTDDLIRWISCLEKIDSFFLFQGLGNFQVEELVTVLKNNSLRISQAADMLRMWQRELSWMVESFHRTFHGPLADVLRTFSPEELPERLKGTALSDEDFVNKAADIVFRDMMNSIPGFLELDRLLDSLLNGLALHLSTGSDEEISSDIAPPERNYFILTELSDADAMKSGPFIGGKAKNLVYLHNKGIRVAPGITFSASKTEKYQEYTESGSFPSILREAVAKLEDISGTVFGDPARPLFLSVRSGSYISMPGILSSILYCGINRETLGGFINNTGDRWLGWDSYRRFIEHYCAVVHNLDMDVFEDITMGFMKKKGVARREHLEAPGMEELVRILLSEMEQRGLEIPEDVYDQLTEAVRAVYRSWFGRRAEEFRVAMKVSPYWGTSVTLMQMILGNAAGAGASVFFTRNPLSMERGIHGETRERATGSDIVYGKLLNRPISRQQAFNGQETMEEADPSLYLMHASLAERVEEAMGGLPQEVEVTYAREDDEGRVIYVLQTKRMEPHRGFTRRFHDVCRMQSNIIGRGSGVHGGALSGIATFSDSREEIRRLRAESRLPVILLRKMASTDDVFLMPEIDGIITSTGGVVSHAAVLAQKFDITAVVACSGMEMKTDEKGKPYATIGSHPVNEGSPVSIDGSTGLVYSGLCLLTMEEET